jgi:hypothetical protein
MTSIQGERAGLRLGGLAAIGAVAVLSALSGCAPTLQWRELRADGRALVASFPCRPERRSRSVVVGRESVAVSMLSCAAGGSTYAIAFADVADPGAVSPGLEAWRQGAASNLGVAASAAVAEPMTVPGMTPNAAAGRLRIEGRLPDGAAVVEHAAFFVHGLRIYQASVIGPSPAEAALTPFFSSLKLVP